MSEKETGLTVDDLKDQMRVIESSERLVVGCEIRLKEHQRYLTEANQALSKSRMELFKEVCLAINERDDLAASLEKEKRRVAALEERVADLETILGDEAESEEEVKA